MFSPPPSLQPLAQTVRNGFWSAVDMVVAFATLEDLEPRPHEPVADPALHPHRHPLRSHLGPRRPNSAPPRSHHCVTPIKARSRRRHAQHSNTV